MDALEGMQLPKANSNEELEQLSKDKLRPLLPITKFEVREEIYRDKGIDLNIELKYNGNYTGFRFLVQLKSTAVKSKNKDGSYSIPIETSNINYLLNSTLPSVYVLYIKNEDQFYFLWVSDVLQALEKKSKKWKEQSTNTIRIATKLNNEQIDSIYDFVLKKGKFQRNINDKLAIRTGLIDIGDKIIINQNLEIYDEERLKEILENIGFQLINEGKSHEIIKVVGNLTKSIENSGKVCLVLGIASYYTGRLMDAINYFSKARKISRLNDELIDELNYFDLVSKFSLGFISEKAFNNGIEKLEETGNIGLYIKIEKAKNDFFKNVSPESYNNFRSSIQEIEKKADKNINIKLIARCEDQFVHGTFFNSEFLTSIATINVIENQSGPNLELRAQGAAFFRNGHKSWVDKVNKLEKDIREHNNIFAYSLNLFYFIKVKYELSVISEIFRIEQEIPNVDIPNFPDLKEEKKEDLLELDKIIERYKYLENYENMSAALSLKYEILHFIGEYTKANDVLKDMKKVVDSTDLERELLKIETLENKGTTHERYQELYDSTIKRPREEFNKIIEELNKIDEEEINRVGKNYQIEGESFIVNLFPIGYFQFAKSNKQKFYDLLNIKGSLRVRLDDLFEKIIPIINIKKAEINVEGYANDSVPIEDIDTLRLIYSRRKLLFENSIYRINLEELR